MSTKRKRVKAILVDINYVDSHFDEPRWVLPRTPEAYDQMVEQMIVAIFREDDEPHWHRANLHPYYKRHAIAALRAIGITRQKVGRK